MNYSKTVSIVILNWNGFKDTIECLKTLFAVKYENFNIVLVDNGSTDESIIRIKEFLNETDKEYILLNRSEAFASSQIEKKDLYLMLNEKNEGFCIGNNIGIKFVINKIYSDFVLLLNNDTLVEPDFLDKMVEVSENDSNIGIVGAKIYKYPRKDLIWSAGGKFREIFGTPKNVGENEKDSEKFNKPKFVSFVSGCCMLVRSNLFKEIGFLKEYYFMYYEDSDFCFRAQKKYKIFYEPKARIYHKEGKSSPKAFQLYFLNRNRVRFILENYKFPNMILPLFGTGMSLTKNIIKFSLQGNFRLVKGIFTEPQVIKELKIKKVNG